MPATSPPIAEHSVVEQSVVEHDVCTRAGVASGHVSPRLRYVDHVAEPVPISASLDSIMRSLRGTDRIQIGGVFGRWDEAVGEAIAAHVRPVRLDQGVLTVEADDPAWATQVKFLVSTITARLADVAHVDVERIDVRVARRR